MRYRVHLFTSLFAMHLLVSGCNKKPSAPAIVDNGPADTGKPEERGTTIGPYIANLKNKSPERRAAAIRAIAQYDAAIAIPALLDVLADKGITEGATFPGEANSTREAAVLALLKFGKRGETALEEKGLRTLIDGLDDPSVGVREHTASAIGLLGLNAKTAAAALVKLCADKEDAVRRAAYESLRKIKDVPAQPIVDLLQHEDAKIAYDAGRALGWLKLPKSIIPALAAALQNPVKEEPGDDRALVRMEIAEALAGFGKDAADAVPALIGVLKSMKEEDFARFFRPKPGEQANSVRNEESPAMMALRKIGKPAVPALIEALASKNALVRWQAARILAGIGPDANESLPALQKAFDEEVTRPDGSLDVVAATALGQVLLGGDPAKPVGKIVEILTQIKDDKVQFQIVRLLARFGRKGETAVPALIALLDDKEKAIRSEVLSTLRAFGLGAKPAIPALIKRLADENFDVRREAALTLKSLGPVTVEAVPALAMLLSDKDEALRREVIETLIAIGPAAKAAVPELTKRMTATDSRERKLAIKALGAIGPNAKSSTAELLKRLDDRDEEIRIAALDALGRIGETTPDVVAGVAGRLKDSRMRVRLASVRTLAMLGPGAKASAADVIAFGRKANPTGVVWTSVALYRMGVDAESNLKIVLDALKNQATSVRSARVAAIDAVDLLGPAAISVIPELTAALKDKTPVLSDDSTPLRQRAVIALGKLGPAAKDAVPKITALLKENNPVLKALVFDALGRIGPDAEFASARLREIIRTEPAYAEAAEAALDKIEKR